MAKNLAIIMCRLSENPGRLDVLQHSGPIRYVLGQLYLYQMAKN